MLPVPTGRCAATFTGAIALLVVGIGAASPTAVTLGGVSLVLLAAALAAAMPIGRRARRQRLEFAWWLEHGAGAPTGAVVPGAPFEVHCYIRHRGRAPLLATGVRPLVPQGARVIDAHPDGVALEPEARTEFVFRLSADAVGRVVFHGLALCLRDRLGLFEVPLYFPNPLAVRVLPRVAAQSRRSARLTSALTVERTGRTALRRRGGGTELYELRELQPGDPYNSIAWKASARYGRLMVKEVEHEVQETRWVILDVSGSMRGGEPGSRKLDFGIEAAATEARRAIHEGDRIGLITVDGRVLGHVAPSDGALQMPRIYDVLLAATEVVDEDLTDLDGDELLATVGRYVRHQDGVDFFRKKRGWDVPGLLRHVRSVLPADPREEPVIARDSLSRQLRTFCLVRGIPLAYRPDPRDGSKGPGLAAALRLAGATRSATSIVVITDFDGVTTTEALMAALKLVKAHGHAVSFIVPDAASFAPSPSGELETALAQVYQRVEDRRFREAQKLLGRVGVRVFRARRPDAAAAVVARAQRLARVA